MELNADWSCVRWRMPWPTTVARPTPLVQEGQMNGCSLFGCSAWLKRCHDASKSRRSCARGWRRGNRHHRPHYAGCRLGCCELAPKPTRPRFSSRRFGEGGPEGGIWNPTFDLTGPCCARWSTPKARPRIIIGLSKVPLSCWDRLHNPLATPGRDDARAAEGPRRRR